MHTMKNISKYLGVALLLFGAACSKTQEGTYYNPNKDDSKEIHFSRPSKRSLHRMPRAAPSTCR